MKKEGISRTTAKYATSNTLGHYVASKQAVLDENFGLGTEVINEAQKNKQLVDIGVIRRGLNYHGANEKELKKEREEI